MNLYLSLRCASKRLIIAVILLAAIDVTTIAQSLPDSIPLRILIIRHGEKPDSGYNLNCKGWNRAIALPNAIIPQFGIPDLIYVPNMTTGKKTKTVRMYQTVIPMAIKYNLLVNSKYEETDSLEISDNIIHQKGTILIVWDKKNIAPLVRNMGIRDASINLDWPDKDYDSIWIIEYIRTAEGSLVPRLRRGKENIVPSKECN